MRPRDRIMPLLVQQAGDFVEPPTPENLADSLSGERFPYPTDPEMYRALVAFRHLNTADRIRAAKRALHSIWGAPGSSWRDKHRRNFVGYTGARDADRFWAKVSPEPMSGCWLWAGNAHPNGYGMVRRCGRIVATHRHAWTLVHGPIPAGLFVCHKCDVPLCVNPAHLFLGTPEDNMKDAAQKSRTCYGERSRFAKLTETLVLEILAALRGGERQSSLARRFNVAPTLISGIARGVRWTRVRRTA